mmetsp:Transcript_21141/g.49541  ORF Transcript_21141/g.49541 Transcript_21141/m.49541 type:complete len:379 (+) Transcript_21141:3235-4371(+)
MSPRCSSPRSLASSSWLAILSSSECRRGLDSPRRHKAGLASRLPTAWLGRPLAVRMNLSTELTQTTVRTTPRRPSTTSATPTVPASTLLSSPTWKAPCWEPRLSSSPPPPPAPPPSIRVSMSPSISASSRALSRSTDTPTLGPTSVAQPCWCTSTLSATCVPDSLPAFVVAPRLVMWLSTRRFCSCVSAMLRLPPFARPCCRARTRLLLECSRCLRRIRSALLTRSSPWGSPTSRRNSLPRSPSLPSSGSTSVTWSSSRTALSSPTTSSPSSLPLSPRLSTSRTCPSRPRSASAISRSAIVEATSRAPPTLSSLSSAASLLSTSPTRSRSWSALPWTPLAPGCPRPSSMSTSSLRRAVAPPGSSCSLSPRTLVLASSL